MNRPHFEIIEVRGRFGGFGSRQNLEEHVERRPRGKVARRVERGHAAQRRRQAEKGPRPHLEVAERRRRAAEIHGEHLGLDRPLAGHRIGVRVLPLEQQIARHARVDRTDADHVDSEHPRGGAEVSAGGREPGLAPARLGCGIARTLQALRFGKRKLKS